MTDTQDRAQGAILEQVNLWKDETDPILTINSQSVQDLNLDATVDEHYIRPQGTKDVFYSLLA